MSPYNIIDPDSHRLLKLHYQTALTYHCTEGRGPGRNVLLLILTNLCQQLSSQQSAGGRRRALHHQKQLTLCD